jgi:hypothetical protein
MKKFLLVLMLAPAAIAASGQTTFTTLFTPDLDSLWNASASFFDADQDGDLDLICNGGGMNGLVSELMINNGQGLFTASSQQFISVYGGKVLTGDIDGDGDLDVFLSGANESEETMSMLYRNDGTGVFTEDSNSSILPFFIGDAEFFDSDGDSDLDIISTGALSDTLAATKLYLNDGSGNFNITLTDIDSLSYTFSDISVGDVDSDGDQDIFICGNAVVDSTGVGFVSRLYLNNGSNMYSVSAQMFGGIAGVAKFSDYDNDEDLDLIMCGTSDLGGISSIYNNDGNGQYSLDPDNPIPPFESGSAMKLFDADMDGDQDLFVTGFDNVTGLFDFAYFDNQDGTFVPVDDQPFTGVWAATIEAGDIDGDSDLDLYISGAYAPAFASLYVNMTTSASVQDVATELFHGVHPNPIEHRQLQYSVAGLQLNEAYDVEVMDLLGRTLYRQENVEHVTETRSIDLSGAQPGAYTIVLRSGERRLWSRFLVVGD